MEKQDSIELGKIIYIGKQAQTKAVISNIYDNQICEIIYYDNKGEIIYENIKWSGEYWDFEIQGPCGGYAKNAPRLRPYISILKQKTI